MNRLNLKKSLLTSLLVGSILLVGCGTQSGDNNTTSANGTSAQNNTTSSTGNSPSSTQPQQWSTEPPVTVDISKTYDANVHTNYGDFTIQLFPMESPHTVNNFIFLAKHHFYNHCQFFRIIKTFMIQTGDPTNTGMGGPGYQFADELPPKHPYQKGIVAMANAGANTNGSQFFICTADDTNALQPNYTQFGKVIQGMNVVEKIASIPVTTNEQGEASKPLKVAEITSVDITEK